jgi:EmrB/QacA subfamily drug resistance transporter
MSFSSRLADRVTDDNVKWYTLAAACFGLFMAILDNLVVNVALPTMSKDLDAKATELQWIVSAYTLLFASLQITAGGLGDRFGRKRWFMIGLVIFTSTSFLAALSQNIEMLLAARALQGIGAAFIMPLSLSLISAAFPPEERGRAIGIWAAVSVSSVALGPIVGGILVEYASWPWVFLINVPIGIGAFIVTSAVVRESRDESGTVATDVPGTVLITLAIASLTWGLIEAGNRGWTDNWILASFVAAAVFAVAFIRVEATAENPMIPLRFFKSRTFTGANIDAFLIAFLITGVGFFMTLYQQNIHGFSPVRTGLALLPMVAVMMVGSPISGTLTAKMGPRRLISAGMFVTGLGMLLFLRSAVHASYLDILPAFLVLGLGMSFIWTPMTTAVLNSVDQEKSGIASAINGAIREIGTALGIALLGTIMNRTYQSEFRNMSEVDTLRNDPSQSALQPLIGAVGDGYNLAGQILRDPEVLAKFPGASQFGTSIDQLVEYSSQAFIVGMDAAVIFSAIGIIAGAAISYFLIDDEVVSRVHETEPAPSLEGAELAPAD